MTDQNTNLQTIKDVIKSFRDERNWLQFHDLKNLAEAISIESSELLEHFLWKTKEEVRDKFKSDARYRQQIADELADVITFAINFANVADFDLTKTILAKIKKASKKYPVPKGN